MPRTSCTKCFYFNIYEKSLIPFQGQWWNIAELALSHLAYILSVAPHCLTWTLSLCRGWKNTIRGFKGCLERCKHLKFITRTTKGKLHFTESSIVLWILCIELSSVLLFNKIITFVKAVRGVKKGATTFSITTFSIMTFSITISKLWHSA